MNTFFLKLFLFSLFLFFTSNLYSQNVDNKSNDDHSTSYNLPPGLVFGKKFVKTYDLSYKIEDSKKLVEYKDSELQLAKQISKEDLESLKESDVDNYNYYSIAFKYFDSLSERVKNIYTKNELWYIYIFDQELKNKLLTIK
ncbi:hypothetical protein [uncultured Flavobacterium sp.]|jgi:hypothetical protein|uniref:hypothetical protein n=1 Tax=uncultured Flavobacterium sp. TaxID=165435 RepID=UPI0025969AE8|nr:hypothetical protein [uncultured Flavobacterium sp.]